MTSISIIKADPTNVSPYISPGIRIGYIFGEGFTSNIELTLGLFIEKPPYTITDVYHTSIGIGSQSIRHRNGKKSKYNYISGQVGWSLVGLSVGRINYSAENKREPGLRVVFYSGALQPFVLISYEIIKISNVPKPFNNLGIWGKLPIVISGDFWDRLATCFAEGTGINMADGSLKKIENIEVGDVVLSYNFVTRQTEPDEVIELYQTANANMMEMRFSDGTIIHSTFDHPYYVKDKGWCSLKPDVTNDLITNITDVGQLEVGDICHLLKDGELTEVVFSNLKKIATFQRTYTIKKLKNNNAFFAEGILVAIETVRNPSSLLSMRNSE